MTARTRPGVGTFARLVVPGGVLALVLGIIGGLARIEPSLIGISPRAAVDLHGPLLVFGFLGVLIGAERAVVLRRWWGYTSPLAGAAGTITALAWSSPSPGSHPGATLAGALWSLAALSAAATVIGIDRARPTPATKIMLVSCGLWSAGAIAWTLGVPSARLLASWCGFPALMILGERMQFGRLTKLRGPLRAAHAAIGALLVGALLALAAPALGMRVAGAAFIALGAWLITVDAPRHVVRAGTLRFVSLGTIAASLWIIAAGLIWLIIAPGGGLAHDAAIHALLQGFVVGMVMAHAVIVFPTVVGRRMPFRPWFYAHVALLHSATLVRVAGDALDAHAIARAGSLASAAAIALFLAATATSALLPAATPLRERPAAR